MFFPIIHIHPDTTDDMHYTEVLRAIQWDEVTIGEWQPYVDCVAEINEWVKNK